jgi:hypothetical protein
MKINFCCFKHQIYNISYDNLSRQIYFDRKNVIDLKSVLKTDIKQSMISYVGISWFILQYMVQKYWICKTHFLHSSSGTVYSFKTGSCYIGWIGLGLLEVTYFWFTSLCRPCWPVHIESWLHFRILLLCLNLCNTKSSDETWEIF